MKRTWETPKLIALVRSKPQEAVLDACKFLHVGSEPMVWFPGCAHGSEAESGCAPCYEQVDS
jgi:hypothetical protein